MTLNRARVRGWSNNQVNNVEPLQSIFARRLFRIPDYQRSYAWGEKQWKDLLDDLQMLRHDNSHFGGTLVLCRTAGAATFTDNEGSDYDSYDVIDGQQRLTTLVMLLDAISDEMANLPDLKSYAQGIRRNYLCVYDHIGQPVLRLRLGQDTHDYFFRNVLGFGHSIDGAKLIAHTRLRAAHKRFADFLVEQRETLNAQYGDWLMAFYRKVTSRFKMLVYEIESDAEAGVIFEAMNNRGKGITEMDKVKNHLLYLATKLDLSEGHDLAERINKTWTDIFHHLMAAGLIEGDDEDRLLRVHWLMAYNYQLDQWKQIESIKERFNLRNYEGNHAALLVDLKEYVETLGMASLAFAEIYGPELSNGFGSYGHQPAVRSKIVGASEKLRRLGQIAPFLSLLIAARLRCPDDGETYYRAVTLCELFAFRVYSWLGRRSNVGQSRLLRLGYDIFTRRQPVAQALDNLQRAALEFCSDAQFVAGFDASANWYEWHSLKYFLYEYEQHLADQLHIKDRLPWSYVEARQKRETIEHILPQSPADSYWSEWFTPEQLARWTHDIGNLCLTRFNPELSNKPFPEKVGTLGAGNGSGYINSLILQERALAVYPEWNEAVIIERRNKLRDWALERWRVPHPPLQSDESDLELMTRVLTRIPVPWGQRQLFRALYDAGENGLTGAELAELMGRRPDQLAGVLGALGHRINRTAARTDGRVVGTDLILRWEQRNGEWTLRLRPEFREVLESDEVAHLGIVKPAE